MDVDSTSFESYERQMDVKTTMFSYKNCYNIRRYLEVDSTSFERYRWR